MTTEQGQLRVEHVEIKSHPNACLVRLYGHLDSSGIGAFEEILNKVIAAGGKRIFVNGKELSFISSAGIGVLIGAQAEIEDDGGQISLVQIEGTEMFETFNTLGYLEMFTVFASDDAAIASLG